MKLTCTKEQLNHAVQVVQKAIATKTPMPVLTGIYLSAQHGKLELQANNYEIGISCTIDAVIEEPGNTVLSGRYFQEMVRKLPGEMVEIASCTEDRTIKITSNQAQFNLLSLAAEEFPVLQSPAGETTLTIKDNILRELIKKTVFSCATDESKPVFTGALLEVNQYNVAMAATNTHRIAIKKDVLGHNVNDLKMIVPAKILNELARIMVSEIPTDITIYYQKNHAAFAFENIYIISRLIEGAFPDYQRVIPPNFATVVSINTDDFMDAVERVSLLARDAEYNIIKLAFKTDCVIITSNNPDIGKAYETVDISMTGNEIEIAFNAKYITDILKNINSEKVVFSLNTPLSPASIKPEDDKTYDYIITPVRIN